MFGVGVLGVGEGWVPAMWGSAAAAPLRPGHPPAFSLRSSASPLRWSEGGLGAAPPPPLHTPRACFARTRPFRRGRKGQRCTASAPGHPPAFSLRSSASPLRWSEGGLGWSALVGCCLGGNDGGGGVLKWRRGVFSAFVCLVA